MSNLAPELMGRARALEQEGFVIVRADGWSFLAVRSRWHWDLAVHLTLVVRVRRLQHAGLVDAERGQAELRQLADRWDPCKVPRGFQHGRGLVDVLVADAADADATRYARTKVGKGYGQSIHTALVPAGGGPAVFGKPVWGRAFWPKIEHAIEVAASGQPRPAPLAGLGLAIALLVFYPTFVAALFFCCAVPHVLIGVLLALEKPLPSALPPA
ncbi:MAG TPA: hypothetical protein RMH99_00490 [Sandaracinaceae bacterium LLY-WYZ-13_1]|nr:hypothetical protein [Sandaracinaceae bacterium LLY-WYZ-13_1]